MFILNYYSVYNITIAVYFIFTITSDINYPCVNYEVNDIHVYVVIYTLYMYVS